MRKIISTIICASVLMTNACEKNEKSDPVFILNNDNPRETFISGFSFIKMDTISYPNSEKITPDFRVEAFEKTIPYLYPISPYGLIKRYENRISGQNHFDTISTITNYPQFAVSEVKPNELWWIKTSSKEIGVILILETRGEYIDSKNMVEIKFKAKKIIP